MKSQQKSPQVLVVWGAKGGVGTSTFALNLAVYASSLGRRVLLLDADAGGGVAVLAGAATGRPVDMGDGRAWNAIAEEIGTRPARGGSGEAEALADALAVAARRPLASVAEASAVAARPAEQPVVRVFSNLWLARVARIGHPDGIRRVREMPVDTVVVDLGAVFDAPRAAWVLDAEQALGVLTPEPLGVARFFRALRTLSAEVCERLAEDDADRAALAKVDLRSSGPKGWQRVLAQHRGRLAYRLRHAMAGPRFAFAINMGHSRQHAELGAQIVSVTRAALGVHLECAGSVDFDDVMRHSAAHCRPMLIDNPVGKVSRGFERLARHLLAQQPQTLPAGRPPDPSGRETETLYDVLEVGVAASDDEIRRGFRRLHQAFEADCLAGFGAWDPGERERNLLRLQEAQRVLTNAALREAYDLSIQPPGRRLEPRAEPASRPAPTPKRRVLKADEIPSGALLREAREARRLELADVAQRTRIRPQVLAAIEKEDSGALPSGVYLRGFLRQYAELLGFDGDQVARGYLAQLRR